MELYVKDNSMPLMVLAIATPASQKELLRNHEGRDNPPKCTCSVMDSRLSACVGLTTGVPAALLPLHCAHNLRQR